MQELKGVFERAVGRPWPVEGEVVTLSEVELREFTARVVEAVAEHQHSWMAGYYSGRLRPSDTIQYFVY